MPNLNNLTTQDLQWGTANWSGRGYIDGAKMIWNSAGSLTLSGFSAYVPALSKCIYSDAAITKSGLALTASTWYHVYVYDNAGTPDIEIMTTAPAAPYNGAARAKTGDASRRYVGSVLTLAGGILAKFDNPQSGLIEYLEDIGSTPFFVLNAGTAVTSTLVDCSAVVPVTSRVASIFAFNSASTDHMKLSNPFGPVVPGGFAGFVPHASASRIDLFSLDANRAMTYAFDAAPSGGGGYLYVAGYTYER